MTRPSLATRLATLLGSDPSVVVPTDFKSGTDSLLRRLIADERIEAETLQGFLSDETGQPRMSPFSAANRAVAAVSEGLLKEREAAFLADSDELVLGMVWPHDTDLVDLLAFQSDAPVDRVVIRSDSLIHATPPSATSPAGFDDDSFEDEPTIMENLLTQFDSEDTEVEVLDAYDLLEEVTDNVDEAPIIKLLNLIIVQACKEKASDVHIEAEESVSRVRYRVDGLLKEVMLPPKRFHAALVSRIKIMSDLDIAEKRSPQDGRMKLRFGEHNIDVRVSTIPSIFGEKVVLRILREESILMTLPQLGFTEQQDDVFKSMITRPYGIILVTGPTGSGKTTTLYTTLNTLNSKAKNIITIEDPVEYQMENISQIQVNRKAGIDFASGLKSILRQDPDIIMLGEMRDEETAAIAVKAALTGHLVFSTLHTNDAAGAYSRLQDMKVAPYLLASAIIGVIAQRLVRVICPDCRIPDDPDEHMLRQIGLIREDGVQLYRGEGCASCGDSGYRGRSALYEILTPTHEVKKLILSGQLTEGAKVKGLQRLVDHGREKVLDGTTTVEEVCRVVRLQEVI
ncbi:MAG: GspE/PulE family protein [Planctomycetota bacterium]